MERLLSSQILANPVSPVSPSTRICACLSTHWLSGLAHILRLFPDLHTIWILPILSHHLNLSCPIIKSQVLPGFVHNLRLFPDFPTISDHCCSVLCFFWVTPSKLYTWVILSLKENVSTLIYVLIKIFVPGDVIAPSFVYDMISHECLSLITWPMVRSAWAGDGKGNSRLVWCDSRCWH